MVRAAAKNHAHVAVVTNPSQYDEILVAVKSSTGIDAAMRRSLAAEAFAVTAQYDAQVARWFSDDTAALPQRMSLHLIREDTLRYGENPHQQGARYRIEGNNSWWSTAQQLGGKEMSYLNVLDGEAGWNLVSSFNEPCVAIIKHANPCGLAVAENIETAYERALACDPISAFGGVVALNQLVNISVAEQVIDIFTEVVIAPAFMPDALELLQTKKNLRIIVAEQPTGGQLHMRSIDGGLLVQESDVVETPVDSWRVVSVATPTKAQLADAAVAWIACASVSSNAITLVRDGQTVGIGGGQQNRVDATRLACERAGERAHGAVAASDAFFPFRDGPDMLARHGVAVVVQPGGSQRDEESIASANEHGIVMIFTDIRHFKH
jgi:phosphoribosylaminoimidazolecarboxamide formyltransferase/IMP cyclohydrolase